MNLGGKVMTFFKWTILTIAIGVVYFAWFFGWSMKDEEEYKRTGRPLKLSICTKLGFIGGIIVILVATVVVVSVFNILMTCYVDDNRYGSVTSNKKGLVSDYYTAVNVDMHDSLEQRDELSVEHGYFDKVEATVDKKELSATEFLGSLVGINKYLNYSWIENTSYYQVSGKDIIDSYKLSDYVYLEDKASYMILDKFIVYTDIKKDLSIRGRDLYTIEYDKTSSVVIDGKKYYNKAIIKKGVVS